MSYGNIPALFGAPSATPNRKYLGFVMWKSSLWVSVWWIYVLTIFLYMFYIVDKTFDAVSTRKPAASVLTNSVLVNLGLIKVRECWLGTECLCIIHCMCNNVIVYITSVCVNSIYSFLVTSLSSAVVILTLILLLLLFKSENKKFKPATEDLTGPLMMVEHIVQQDYFPSHCVSTLHFYITQ